MNERELLVQGIREAVSRLPGDDRLKAAKLHVGPGALRAWLEDAMLPNSVDLEYLARYSGMTVEQIQNGGRA